MPMPLSLHGVPSTRFPRFTGTMEHSDSSTCVPPRFSVVARRYRSTRTRRGLSGSWAVLAYVPCSSTPARAPCSTIVRTALLPSGTLTASALAMLAFRGSITQPAASLSTLRSRGRPRTTQDSLPAGWSPLAGRGLHPLDSFERFRASSSLFSSPRLCLTHQGARPPAQSPDPASRPARSELTRDAPQARSRGVVSARGGRWRSRGGRVRRKSGRVVGRRLCAC
jgi:hypothetical protein